MQAILVKAFGGTEVLEWGQAQRPVPAGNQVLVQLAVSGVNFLDVAQRKGATAVKAPYIAGVEGVGTVVDVGAQVGDLAVGQRVGWMTGGQGSFADYAVVDAAKAVPLPDDIDDATAVAALMQGITAHYLATDTYPIRPGDAVIVHAAAGGVGHLLTQIAKLRGATVIGTTSSAEKAETARGFGADHVLSYDGFAGQARKLTGGEGVAAVFDGIGATTYQESLAALRIRGTLVLIGNASGPVPAIEVSMLNAGSLYVTRPTAIHHTRTPEELRGRADDVFSWIRAGKLRVNIGGTYPVSRAGEAFDALESRRTQGKLLLTH